MKKIITTIFILIISLIYSFGQTYYYQCNERIDENEVKYKANDSKYITFNHQQRICYYSDKDGYKNGYVFKYKGDQDGIHIYLYDMIDEVNPNLMMGAEKIWKGVNSEKLYFNSDYSKMNRIVSPGQSWSTTYIYIKTQKPEEVNTEKIKFY